MASIDNRVVRMAFEGAGFLGGVTAAISALAKLKSSLGGLKGAGQSINDLDAAGKKFSLEGMAKGIDGLASKFSNLGIVGITVLTNIANRAINAGLNMAKALTVSPIAAGLDIYSTKLNAMQTILANTAGQQGSDIKSVTAALSELNQYANQTIYRFADMAQNIGTFTAAGVDIKTSVSSIKGLANIAALSGSSAEQASTAMYQLSQAIASGSVKLMDWNSVVNAGMGGKVFQNALIQTAKAHGIAVDQMIKKDGSFRESLKEGWLTSKVLTDTLSTFTGDLSAAQLKSMGYTDAQTKAILAQGKAAVDSATKVRTLPQLWAAIGDSIATSWANVWEALLGNLTDAQNLLTGVLNVFTTAFTTPVNNLAKFIGEFRKLGGMYSVIEGIKNIFQALGLILRPIKQAFQDVFPPATAAAAALLANKFQLFTEKLKISGPAMIELQAIFKGFFSAIKIGIDIVKGIFGVIGKLFAAIAHNSAGFLDIAANVGDFVSNLKDTIESGKGLTKFFDFLAKVLIAPIALIGLAAKGLSHLGDVVKAISRVVGPVISAIGNAFRALGSGLMSAIRSGDLSKVATLVNQVLFGGILLAVRNFISNFGKKSAGGGIVDAIKAPLKALTGTLKDMQTNLKADTLLKIAAAVGILAVSMVAISLVNAGDLSKALGAMTVMFTELLTAMAVVSKIAGLGGIASMAVVAASLNLLATAILILTGAVAILAQFSWTELAKGLGSIAVMLGLLVAAVSVMGANAKGTVTAAFAMTIMAAALNVLAGAVILLGKTDFKVLLKGVGTIAALLLIMAGFNLISGVQLVGTAASILIIAGAMVVLGEAIKQIGSMSLATIGKGLGTIAAGLLIIAGAMWLMPPNMLATAAGLLIVSAALVVMSKALDTMGGMTWTEIAKSLIELAGALVIIAAAMIAMTGALPGAAALVVVAAALTILTPVLIALSSMSWTQIAIGLVALAGAFTVIGLAGLLLGPIIPFILGLGAAVALIGVGFLAAGAGMLLFATGIAALAAALTAAGGAIVSFVGSVLSIIPTAMGKLGEGIVAFADAIAKGGPALIGAFSAVIYALLTALNKNIPLMITVFGKLLSGMLGLIQTYAPRVITTMLNLLLALLTAIANKMPQFVQKGADLVVNFLNGIAANIGRIITAGVNIIVNFLNGIAANMPRIGTAGGNVVIAFINAVGAQASRISQAAINMIINFVNSLANQIRNSSGAMQQAGLNLAGAIIDGMTFGLASKAGGVISKAQSIASSIASTIGGWLGFHSPAKKMIPIGASVGEGLIVGMENSAASLQRTSERTGNIMLTALQDSLSHVQAGVGEINPVITPVLDLSLARRGFDDLAALADANTSRTLVSTIRPVSRDDLGRAALVQPSTVITFTQTNTSPKALSTAEIYRQTRNQLTAVKGALPA